MASETIKVNAKDLKKLITDIEIIKSVLLSGRLEDSEGELSDWAKKELAEARKIPDSKNISLEEMEKVILAK